MEDGTEPVADDELLYRRIPASTGWYSPDSGLKPESFAPHKEQDKSGLSLWRSKYKSLDEAAIGRPGKSYFVAQLRAGDLRSRGIKIEPRPIEDDIGHAELPELNSQDRKSDRVLEFQAVLVELCLGVEGPYPTPSAS